MLTPEQIDALRDWAEKITDPVNNYLIRDIARRVAQAGQLTSTASYEVFRAQQLGTSRKKIELELQKLLNVSSEDLKELLTQAAEVGYRFDLDRFPIDAVPFEENAALQQIVSAAVNLADQNFQNITQTLGMVTPDGTVSPLQDAYRKCTDFAFNQVVTGAADYNTAIRNATKNLANQGVRVIDYESGVHTSLEAAVRRNIMGGLGLMQEEISQKNHDAFGADGWEISAHAASAPDHEPIQGKQYSDKEYEALNASLPRRIGTLNCGHAAFPVILGLNEPMYTEEELEQFKKQNQEGITYQGKHYTLYEATQKQRQIERTVRRQKRRVIADEGSGDKDRLTIDRVRLVRLNEEYAAFSKAAKLPTQPERARIAGFNHKKTKEARATAQNYHNEWLKSIGAEDTSLKKIAKYYEGKYNDSEEYRLLIGYNKAIQNGDISPLIGLDAYMKIAEEIQNKIIGMETSTGVKIESCAPHFIDRVIGQTSTPHAGMRQGVSVDDALEALTDLIARTDLVTLDDGDVRQTFKGEHANVTISVRDKRLIQANKARR